MFKLFKKIRTLAVIAVIAVVVVVLGGSVLVDGLVRRGIEAGATRALKVGVAIDHLGLALMSGSAGMTGLAVDNPAGFEAEHLLTLKDGSIQLEIGSLLKDVVNIKDIQLKGAHVVVEQKGLVNNNLQTVLKGLPRSDGTKPSEPSGKKLHIDNLELTDITVEVKFSDLPGKTDAVNLTLPPIRMQDIGGDKPIDTAGLTAQILAAIAKGVAEQASGILPDDVIGNMQESLGNLSGLKDTLTEKGQELLEQGKEAGRKITEGLGDLLKKD